MEDKSVPVYAVKLLRGGRSAKKEGPLNDAVQESLLRDSPELLLP